MPAPHGTDGDGMLKREELPVLVVQAESLGALGVIRSLGRAGYPVHACATTPDAVGLASTYATARVCCPPYAAPEFLPWLRSYLLGHGIRAIVPSESLLLALRPVFAEFAPLLCCGDDAEIVYAGMSKYDLFSRLGAADSHRGSHLPPTLLMEDLSSPPTHAEVSALGLPLYLKVDGAYSTTGETGAVFKAHTAREALEQVAVLAPRFRRGLLQGHVVGQGVGAFFLLHHGAVLAEFMHRRIHEVPHTGGASSLRESWQHPAIRDDALAKLRQMRWQGVAMMEYRWNPETDAFALMEMNGRFWGSLHLALHAGVDFPRLLVDAFFGGDAEPVSAFPVGLRCRNTFPGELQYVYSRLRDSTLSVSARAWSVAEFFLLSLDPRVRTDLAFKGDRGPLVHGLRTAAKASARLLSR